MKRLLLLLGLLLLCSVEVDAQQLVTVYYEDFDGVADIANLEDWEAGSSFRISATASSNGSGFNNLEAFGNDSTNAVTPSIDLRRLTEGSLDFRYRRTTSFDFDRLQITASTDGGLTFPYLIGSGEDMWPATNAWRLASLELPPEVVGMPDVRFRLEHMPVNATSGNARFDDMAVRGMAVFDIVPPEGLFAAEPGETDTQTFVLINYGEDPLVVHAPVVSDPAFSISPTTGVTLAPSDSHFYEITFAPQVEGVVVADVAIETNGAGGVTIPLMGLTSINQVSFAAESSAAGEAEMNIPVDLTLTFSNEEANLHGLQASVSWDDDIMTLANVTAGPQVSGNGWSLSYESGDKTAEILLYDNNGHGLSTGYFEPVITLYFDATYLDNGPRDVSIKLDKVIGALAVPTGDDAELLIRKGEHIMRIEKREAHFTVDVEELNFGILEAGSDKELTFEITNPGGERPLVVTGFNVSGMPLTIEPATATVLPDGSETFTVTFAPTVTQFGFLDEPLRIQHNAALGAVYDLPLLGVGIYGRGDNDGDGMVDAMDVVNAVDFILGRTDPTTQQLGLTDMYPFPNGDARLDVRDLTVNVQAIVRGIWPDDVTLPPNYDPEILETLAANKASSPSVVVTVEDHGEELILMMTNEEPLRALQLHLHIENLVGNPLLFLNSDGAPTSSGRAQSDENGIARILLYRPDGGAIAPGTYRFASVTRTGSSGAVEREYATAVAEGNERRRVEIFGLTGTHAPSIPHGTELEVQHPYPNPIRAGGAQDVRIPVVSGTARTVRMEVFDILGRRFLVSDAEVEGRMELRWDVRDSGGNRLAPGIYFMRIMHDEQITTRQVVVVQ